MEQPPQLINFESASPSRSRANFDLLHYESNVGEQTKIKKGPSISFEYENDGRRRSGLEDTRVRARATATEEASSNTHK